MNKEIEQSSPWLTRVFYSLAFVILVTVVLGRNVVPEIPFRTSYLLPEALTVQGSQDTFGPDRVEYAGVFYGCGILVAGFLWAVGGAVSGKLKIRYGWMLLLIGGFAVWSFLSVINASDKRAAVNFAFMQSTLMFAGWLMIQLCCADRKRIGILLAVLVAFGAMLAVKGLWQQFVETPQRIEHFKMYRSEILQTRGIELDSPLAVAYEKRLAGTAPIGYIAMANPFGSMLLVLGAAALGITLDRLKNAILHAKATVGERKKGEIHGPTFAAILCFVVAGLILFVTFLTRSRGAIGSLALMLVGGLVVFKFREKLAKHWKICVAVILVSCFAVGGSVVGWGMKKDSLPTKTMTFRWFYWTGAAKIVAERPWFGTGGGNFGTAYQRHRRPAAEEATKTPHNFVMHSLSQYGVVGGGLYLAVLFGMLIAACRPAASLELPVTKEQKESQIKPLLVVAGIMTAVFGSFILFTSAHEDLRLLVVELIDNGLAFAVVGVLMFWTGGGFSLSACSLGRFTRIIVVCGLLGFVLHNCVTFSLWMGGPAMLFWIVAGAVVAMVSADGTGKNLTRFRWVAVCVSLVLAGTAIAGIYYPVSVRQKDVEDVNFYAEIKNGSAMITSAGDAVRADWLDGYTASLAARLASVGIRADHGKVFAREQSMKYAAIAINRDPMNSSHYKLAADILWGGGEGETAWPGLADESLEYLKKAIALDPQDFRMRIKYAKRLMMIGDAENRKIAQEQIKKAVKINDSLFEDSIYRLSDKELCELHLKH